MHALQQGQHDETLVLLHGIGGCAEYWRPQLQGLSESYRVVALDLPGYGQSPLLPEVTFPALSQALAEFLVEQQLSAVHLLGHSFGGMLAQQFVADYPQQVKTLILSGTSPAFGRPDGDFQQRFVNARLGPLDVGKTMADIASDLVTSLIGADPDPVSIDAARQSMAAVPEATYRAIIHCLVGFDRRDNLPHITCPTLLLAAENDNTAPPLVMAKMAAKIPASNYRCMAKAGHLNNLEQPQTFNQIVLDFLEQHSL